MSKMKECFWFLLSYFAIVMAILLIIYVKEPAFGGDSGFYIKNAEELIGWLSGSNEMPSGNILYFGYVFIVALGKVLAGENWLYAVVSIQTLLVGLTTLGIYLLTRQLWPQLSYPLVVMFSVILPLANPDLLVFSRYLLTDAPFAGLAAIITSLMIIRYYSANHLHNIQFLTWLLLPIFLFFRPDSLSWLIATFLLIITMKLYLRGFSSSFIVFSLLFLTMIFSSVLIWFIYRPEYWPIEIGKGMLIFSRNLFMEGVVIHGQLGTYSAPPSEYLDFIVLALKRSLFYFQYWNENYSDSHNFYRHVYFGPIFFLVIYYFVQRTRCNIKLEDNERALLWFTFLLTLVNNLLHVMTVIAYEFRYQLILFGCLWPITLLGIRQLMWDLGLMLPSENSKNNIFYNH